MDMDISMDVHVKSVYMDIDMDMKFHIYATLYFTQPRLEYF